MLSSENSSFEYTFSNFVNLDNDEWEAHLSIWKTKQSALKISANLQIILVL